MKQNMQLFFEVMKDTPWKLTSALFMLICTPFTYLYLKATGVQIGKYARFYGKCLVYRHKNSVISIGDHFENRNWWDSNPLGVDHPTIFTTWGEKSRIQIGNNVGITGGSICAQKKIVIGDGCLIGANSTIVDTDFHPINSSNRRYSKKNVKASEVNIGKNVFIGMNSIILKGVKIGDNSIIGAGSVVRKNIPKDSIYSDGRIIKIRYEN